MTAPHCGQPGRPVPPRHAPTFNTWRAMRHRCLNPKAANYARYGGRGITICAEWRDSYEQFVFDMGERPPGTTLDRIDVDGPYSPANCTWSTAAQQRANQRPRPPADGQLGAEFVRRGELLRARHWDVAE